MHVNDAKALRSEDVEVRELVGVVVSDVVDARVRGGAEEAAGDGGALHAEEECVAGVVDVHQRLGAEQALHQPEEHEGELLPEHRRHGVLQRLRRVAEDRVARDQAQR